MSEEGINKQSPHPGPLFEAARDYLNRGWYPVPIPSRAKRPILKDWPNLRLRNEELPEYFQENANIGLILGEPSGGLVDVDLDCEEARELADQFLPPTQAITGRASTPGSHRWYLAEGVKTAKHQNPIDKSMIVELRSTGTQTVVGPSLHPSGEEYDRLTGEPAHVPGPMLEACVAALADAVIKKRQQNQPAPEPQPVSTPNPTNTTPAEVERRALAYLETIPGAVSGQGGHNSAYSAAVALVHGFGIESEKALQILLEQYNPRCEPPWSEKELRHKVDDAARKPHNRPFGWLRDAALPERQPDPEVDLSVILNKTKSQKQPAKPASPNEPRDPGPFPEHLLHIPGFIGKVMEYNKVTAFREQPILALGASLALLGTLSGRKVCDEVDTRTNIYCLGVCPSGMGKERPREINKEILYLAGARHLIGPEGLASHAGVISAVEQQPSLLFQLDEIGRLLRTLSDASRSPHLFHIATNLMKLYTSSNSLYVGDAYSDAKRNKEIIQPNACLFGTTAPRWLYEGLTIDSISDGFLARILLLEATSYVAKQRKRRLPIPEEIIEIARWWSEFNPGGNLSREHPQPRVIPSSEAAERLFDALDDYADGEQLRLGDPLETLWTRTTEKARKLALLYACSRDHEDPSIDEEAAQWGCDLSRYTTERMIYLASQWISENPYDAKRKRVLRLVTKAGKKGLTRSQLYAKTRHLTTRERNEIIEALLLCDDMRSERDEKTGGAPSMRFVATTFIEGTSS